MDRIASASAALLLHDSRGGLFLGSAICLRLGERSLLATAAHNLRRIHHVRPILGGRYRGDPMRFVRLGVGGSEGGDVAWIELCPRDVDRYGVRGLGLEDLDLRGPAERSRLLAHGFPAQGVDPAGLGGTRFELVGVEIAGRASAADGGEVRLTWRPERLPSAFCATGLSGGGIWRAADDGRHLLVGLTRSWHAPSCSLLGTRIERWLGIVGRDFPELIGLWQPPAAEPRSVDEG